MLLKIHTVHGVIFDGNVEMVELPTKVWVLSILPHHNPLTAMITPWIVKFIPLEKRKREFIADTDFLFEDEKITIAVWEGTIYTDWAVVILFVASATITPKSDREALEEMKQNLEKQIKEIRASWNSDEIERAYLNLQKLTADMELLKIKERKWGKILRK